jgi:hypothetical protein
MKGYAEISDMLTEYPEKITKHPMKIYIESDLEAYILIQAPRPIVIYNLVLFYDHGSMNFRGIYYKSFKQSRIMNMENYGKYDMIWEYSTSGPFNCQLPITIQMDYLLQYRLEVVALNSKSHMNYLTFGKTGDLFIGSLGEPLNVTFLL